MAEQRLRETNEMLRSSNVELKKELESERLKNVALHKEKVHSSHVLVYVLISSDTIHSCV